MKSKRKKPETAGAWLMPRAVPFLVAHQFGRVIRPLPVGNPPALTITVKE